MAAVVVALVFWGKEIMAWQARPQLPLMAAVAAEVAPDQLSVTKVSAVRMAGAVAGK
jgi:hypothetical protein